MRVGFEKIAAPVPQALKNDPKVSPKPLALEPGRETNVSASSTEMSKPEKIPKNLLVVTLKAMVPSADKKSTVLYVFVDSCNEGRLRELVAAESVPYVVNSHYNICGK
jgi:hypothetical protein